MLDQGRALDMSKHYTERLAVKGQTIYPNTITTTKIRVATYKKNTFLHIYVLGDEIIKKIQSSSIYFHTLDVLDILMMCHTFPFFIGTITCVYVSDIYMFLNLTRLLLFLTC